MLYELFWRCIHIPYREVGASANYAWEKKGRTLYLYFEKSNGATDWRRNLDFPAKPYKRMGRTLWYAHRGFLAAWREIQPRVAPLIRDLEVEEIIIAGYSHGAAVAVFCHEYAWFHRPELREKLYGYGFGCPRVFWGIPAGKLLKRWEHFVVIRNLDDIVTHLPPACFGFSHVGTVLEVGKKGAYTGVQAHFDENILVSLAVYEAQANSSTLTARAFSSPEVKTNSLFPATKEISR